MKLKQQKNKKRWEKIRKGDTARDLKTHTLVLRL